MPIELIFLIPVLFVALIAALIIASIRAAKKRREALEAFARDMDFTFNPKGGGISSKLLNESHLFRQGSSRTVRNLMHGTIEDLGVYLFDYSYTIHTGKHSTTTTQTVVAFELGGRSIPVFDLRPEHFFHRIGQAFGYQDIDIVDRPAFSKAYLLRGPDEQAIRTFFTGPILDMLEQDQKWSIESTGDFLILYQAGRRVRVHDLSQRLEAAFTLCNRLV
jgi:hypothetical protein